MIEVKKLEGSWELTKNEHLDEFLTELGFSWLVRKAAGSASMKLHIIFTENGVIVETVSLKTQKTEIKWNEEHSSEFGNGITFIQDDKLVSKIKGEKGEIINSRYLKDDELIMELCLNGVKCLRHFKKI